MALRISETPLISDPNLQGYWPLDDSLSDLSGNGYDLTSSGSPSFVAAQFGDGVEFISANSQYLFTDTDTVNLNTTGSQTWLYWLKPTTDTTRAGAMSIFSSGEGERKLWIDSNLDLYARINGLSIETIGPNNVGAANVFYFVAMVYDAENGKFKVWINDTKFEEDVTGTPTTLAVNQMTFGQDNGSSFHDSVQDEHAFFDRALTDGEIDNLVNGVAGSASSSVSSSISSSVSSSISSSVSSSVSSSDSSSVSSSTSSSASISASVSSSSSSSKSASVSSSISASISSSVSASLSSSASSSVSSSVSASMSSSASISSSISSSVSSSPSAPSIIYLVESGRVAKRLTGIIYLEL